MITAEHIRLARVGQIATLLDITVPHASEIVSGKKQYTEKLINRGASKGVAKSVLVTGIDAKRQEVKRIKAVQDELDSLLVVAKGL